MVRNNYGVEHCAPHGCDGRVIYEMTREMQVGPVSEDLMVGSADHAEPGVQGDGQSPVFGAAFDQFAFIAGESLETAGAMRADVGVRRPSARRMAGCSRCGSGSRPRRCAAGRRGLEYVDEHVNDAACIVAEGLLKWG